MLHIGCHLSAAGGYMAMGKEAVRIGADTFAFFTRNPRGGAAKDVDEKDVSDFLAFIKEHHFAKIVAHAPYTLNPCAERPEVLRFAEEVMADDLRRMEYTPGQYYNFHPGSHVGQGTEAGIKKTAALLNKVMTDDMTTTVLIETMSGKGSEIGATFEEVADLLEKCENREHMGVCLDTCHVFDGGYDIITDLDGVLTRFDKTVGLDKLCAVHLNDSKNVLASHKDRHELIGKGNIGLEALSNVINHPALRLLPFILETPQPTNDGYAEEIALLRGLYQE